MASPAHRRSGRTAARRAACATTDRRATAGTRSAHSSNEPLALEMLPDASGVLVRGGDDGVQRDLRVLGYLVRIVDAGEPCDLAAPWHGRKAVGSSPHVGSVFRDVRV